MNKMTARVSVILTAYNFEHFVEQSIQSALDQDYPSELMQIVVTNDGSTDSTGEKIQRFVDQYPGRITYIDKPNGGLRSAVNAALEVVDGDYITFLSADDYWPLDSVSRRVTFLEDNPQAGLVYGDLCMVDNDGNITAPSFFKHFSMNPPQGKILGQLIRKNSVSGGGMMFRSSLRERIFPMPWFAPWEDWWIAVRTAEISEISVLPGAPIYFYRNHDNNMNLGSDAAKTASLLLQEVHLLRWMLACVDRTTITLTDLIFCYARLAGCQPIIAKHIPDASIDISQESIQAAHQIDQHIDQAIANGDFLSATHWALKAYALNPGQDRANALIQKIQLMDENANLPVLDDPRTIKVFAKLSNLVSEPALFHEYCERFSQDDDITLVLYHQGSEQQGAELAQQLLEMVPPCDNGPDVLLYYDASGTEEQRMVELVCNARLDGPTDTYQVITQAFDAVAPSKVLPS